MRITAHARARATTMALGVVVSLLLTPQGSAMAGVGGRSRDVYQIKVRPTFGPGGTSVAIQGRGFGTSMFCNGVDLSFDDAQGTITRFGIARVHPDGTIRVMVIVPSGAAIGDGTIRAIKLLLIGRRCEPGIGRATATFTVTGAESAPHVAQIVLRPSSGPAGTSVYVRGRGFTPSGFCRGVRISFIDALETVTVLGYTLFNPFGGQMKPITVTIPPEAPVGEGTVLATAQMRGGTICVYPPGGAPAPFTVTGIASRPPAPQT